MSHRALECVSHTSRYRSIKYGNSSRKERQQAPQLAASRPSFGFGVVAFLTCKYIQWLGVVFFKGGQRGKGGKKVLKMLVELYLDSNKDLKTNKSSNPLDLAIMGTSGCHAGLCLNFQFAQH